MAKLKTKFVQSIFLLSSLLFIGGCATPTTVIVDVERAPIVLPQVDVLQLDKVEWLVITEENYKQVFDALKKQGINPVIFGLTETGYKRLAINTAKIRSLIEQQKSVMEAYRSYYIEEDEARQEAKLNETRKAKAAAAKPWWERIGQDQGPAVQTKTVVPAAKQPRPDAKPLPVRPVLPPPDKTMASESIIVPPVKPVVVK